MNWTQYTGNIERYRQIRENERREEELYERTMYEDSRDEDYTEGRHGIA